MSLGSLIQCAIGNPFGSLVSGTAFGVINNDAKVKPSKDTPAFAKAKRGIIP